MRGQTVVLDSSNTAAVIADAVGEASASPPISTTETKPKDAIASDKTAIAEKEGTKEPEKAAPETKEDPDDVEGEDGLTPRQKRDLTEKMQRAIGKKHRALKEAEEFAAEQYNEKRLAEQAAEQAQREVNRLKAQMEGEKKEPVKPAERPNRENFKTDEEYLDAVSDWKLDAKLKQRDQKAAQQREKDRQQQVLAEASARVENARKLVPDWDDVVSKAEVNVPPVIAGYMQESEMLAELGYHFAKNPAELDRLRAMTPAKALVAIGKIEAILKPFAPAAKEEVKTNGEKPTKETAQEPSKEKPRASAPITPLNSGSAAQVQKDPRNMNYQEARIDWEKQNGVKLGRRQRH